VGLQTNSVRLHGVWHDACARCMLPQICARMCDCTCGYSGATVARPACLALSDSIDLFVCIVCCLTQTVAHGNEQAQLDGHNLVSEAESWSNTQTPNHSCVSSGPRHFCFANGTHHSGPLWDNWHCLPDGKLVQKTSLSPLACFTHFLLVALPPICAKRPKLRCERVLVP
jgi:hypothetical protein